MVVKDQKVKPAHSHPAKNKSTQKTSVKTMSAPSALGNIVVSKPKSSPTVFRRLEEVATITGTTTPFAVTNSLAVNPGLSATFPWLAAPAQAFNLYRFRSLKIHYMNSTNTTNSGLVVVGYNPDPNDLPPTTVQQIENYETHLRVATWENACVEVPKSDLTRLNKFILRSSIVPGAIETYDVGSIFVVCSGNVSSSTTIGEIWLEYVVEFYAPFVNIGSAPIAKASSIYSNTSSIALTSGVQTVMPFGTTLANALGLVNTSGTFTGITGALIVYAQVTLSAATLTGGSLLIIKNGTSLITAAYPPLNGALLSTMNVEGYVSLVPSDVLSIQVVAPGTTLIAGPAPAAQTILVINAA